MPAPPAPRCVCGRSSRFPLCDGGHASEDWACSSTRVRAAEIAIASGGALRNLAERLAADLGGVALHRAPDVSEVGRLIAVTDGTDLDVIAASTTQIRAAERRLIWIGEGAAAAPPGWRTVAVPDVEPLHLWRSARAAARGADPAATPPGLPTVFLSHAVADERALDPALDYMRRYCGLDAFVCADSIPMEANWHAEIVSALRARERFVWIVSEASIRSTFCAFEVGYAFALEHTPRLLSLDGSLPPTWVQHLQMVDLPRLRRRRPWLDERASLVEALLMALEPAPGP